MADPTPTDDPLLALPPGRLLVLFDGVCVFCNASVNFMIDHDPANRICFASLQSPLGRRLQQRFGLDAQKIESLVLIEKGRCYLRSTGALRIARKLSGPWPLASLLVCLPAPLRDAAYDAFARHRYRWFGRLESCRMPTPALRQRFLDVAV
jgi:predicted DCC family thiol-disulfide oxidoreductase YuxK